MSNMIKVSVTIFITIAIITTLTFTSIEENNSNESSSMVVKPFSTRPNRFLIKTKNSRQAADHCKKDDEICYILEGKNSTCCNNKCMDLSEDKHNCGVCKNKCKFTSSCCGGECVNLAYDKRNCGSCGNKCMPGAILNDNAHIAVKLVALFAVFVCMFISKRKHEPAHYMLKIETFSLLLEAQTFRIESDIFEASGHKWRLDLYPNGNDDENEGKHIALHAVICDTENLPKGWEVCVDVCFFVYDHIRQNYVTFQDADGNRTRFHERKKQWGFNELISLKLFMESGNGYLFNDSCVFGVEVIAVPAFTQADRCLLMTKPPANMNKHTWKIEKFSAVTEQILYSEVFKIGKVKWKLSLYPKGLNAGKETDNWFCNSDDDWGFSSFMTLSELNDTANGFLLNDNLIVEVEFSVMGTLKNFI
ncbi:uncharacterized protein [Rutidosis leptorrhynchoides]|uniref:uncharacterized protein n=1 Tax=Rutidosis leptorrhynchoides TaxID=125765 RepID=UPI003A9A50A2